MTEFRNDRIFFSTRSLTKKLWKRYIKSSPNRERWKFQKSVTTNIVRRVLFAASLKIVLELCFPLWVYFKLQLFNFKLYDGGRWKPSFKLEENTMLLGKHRLGWKRAMLSGLFFNDFRGMFKFVIAPRVGGARNIWGDTVSQMLS